MAKKGNPLLAMQEQAKVERETIIQNMGKDAKEDKRRTTIYLTEQAYKSAKTKAMDKHLTLTAYLEELVVRDTTL